MIIIPNRIFLVRFGSILEEFSRVEQVFLQDVSFYLAVVVARRVVCKVPNTHGKTIAGLPPALNL